MRPRPLLIALACCLVLYGCRHQELVEHVRIVPQVSPVQPRRVQFSPVDDRRLLVVEATGLVGVWDVSDVQAPQLFASIDAGAIDATFSPDAQFIATVGVDGQVHWWSVDGHLQWTSKGRHASPARAIAVAFTFIASGSEDGEVRLWALDGSPLGEQMRVHQGAVVSLAISPRGDLASVGADDAVYLWTHAENAAGPPSAAPKLLYRAESPSYRDRFIGLARMDTSWGWDHSIAFSANGDLVAAALFDDSVRVWSIDGALHAVVLDAHPSRHVRAVAFSPTHDTFATAGFDGTVRQWNFDGSPHGGPIYGHEQVVFSVAFSRHGDRLATAGYDNTLRIWKATGARLVEFPHGHEDRIQTVALAAREPVLAAATEDGDVRLWNLDGTPRGQPLVGHNGPVDVLAISPKDDLVASAGHDGTVRLWDLDGAPLSDALGVGPRIGSIVFSPQSDVWAAGTGPFQVWAKDRALWQRTMRGADRVGKIAFSPRGDFIVTGSVLGDLQVWNRNGSTRTPALKQKWEWITAVAVSPDGDYFAAVDGGGYDRIFGLFNLDGSPRGEPLDGHFGTIEALAFTPKGQLVSAGQDGIVRLWTLPSRQVETIDVGLWIQQLGFWRDLLWIRANGDTIFFYDKNYQLIATMLLRRNGVLTFTPDGWLSGTNEPARFVRMYRDDGTVLSEAQATLHVSSQKVLDALQRSGNAGPS
jgi:WD40 repeat protein